LEHRGPQLSIHHANQITVQISASDIATAGMIPVYVHSSGGIYGNGVNSNTVTFTVN